MNGALKTEASRPSGDRGGLSSLHAGPLELRLAESEAEVDATLALRYRVFYEEMAAQPSPEMAAQRRDFDAFDAECDHLLVIDHDRGGGVDAVIGTYRLIQRPVAERQGGFYTAEEFDISRLLAYPGHVLELGRSCVDSRYRTRMVLQLMWRGIAAYISHFNIDLMFGCASLPGTDPNVLASQLSYLYHYHLAPPALRPRALPHRYTDMRFLRSEEIDPRQAINTLPPLIKGYLRLGGCVGDGAVIDRQFNTTDVCTVVKTENIAEKYQKHYERTTRDATAA